MLWECNVDEDEDEDEDDDDDEDEEEAAFKPASGAVPLRRA